MAMNTKKLQPTLRFPEFSGAWQEKRLGDVVDIYDGTHTTPKYVKKGIPFYSVEHLTNNNFTKTKYITEDVFRKENKRVKLEQNDILMTRIGDIGTSRLITWDVKASFYVSIALIKHSNRYNSSFLNQYIKSNNLQKELHKRTIHVAFPKKINLGEIGNCYINLPTLPEQTKIANFLSNMDEKIDNTKKQLSLWQLYKKGIMQKLFSQALRFKDDSGQDYPDWQEKRLGDVATITTGNSNREDSGTEGKYTFFDRSEDIRASDKYLFDDEAIIVAGEGQNFIPKYFIGKFDLHQRTYAIIKFKDVCSKYLYYFIYKNANYFLSQAVGSTVKSLRLPMFIKMSIIFPHIKEQTKIANLLSGMDEKIDKIQRSVEQLKVFKKGLLQKMFV